MALTGTNSQSAPVRVLVVDDSAIVRGLLTKILDSDPEITVVGSASNGKMALLTLAREDVDVIVLDIEMPVMDGLTALPKLLELKPAVKVIMASTLTLKNAKISLQSLELGASDYIAKPSNGAEINSTDGFKWELTQKVKLFGSAARKAAARDTGVPRSFAKGAGSSAAVPVSASKRAPNDIKLRSGTILPPKAIAIGSSTGGPQALAAVLEKMARSVQVPILITQHMPPTFTTLLAEHLTKLTGVKCHEAKGGEDVVGGEIYLAPGGAHMLVEHDGAKVVTRLSDSPPENFCRPSVDPMLRSMIEVYGNSILTVILTGMGSDGLKGAEQVVAAGGAVIAQDEETSVVWGMPGAVATAGICSAVLPLDEIPTQVLKFAMRTAA